MFKSSKDIIGNLLYKERHFRGWCIDEKRMYEESYLLGGFEFCDALKIGYKDGKEVKLIVMESVYCKDNNQKLLFEGDILRYQGTEVIIVAQEGKILAIGDGWDTHLSSIIEEVTKIGNIFENIGLITWMMIFVGKNRINGKEMYKRQNQYYYFENGEYVQAETLSKEQLEMIELLHGKDAIQLNF
jgi:hypothetical protein